LPSRRQILNAAAVTLAGLAVQPARAEAFPSRAVKLVIPWPPGGGTDIYARVIGQELGTRWGQSVVVENRAGAAGNIGATQVASAAPDGYTLMLATITLASNPSLYKDLPFDTRKSFAPVTEVAGVPHLLVVRKDFQANSVQQLIDLAKARPHQLNYASAGSGSPFHLAAELFKQLAHVDITHVPYKGGAPAITDVLGGQVQMTFANFSAVLPHIRSGALKPLGITSAKRSAILPDVPTIAESGVPGYEFTSWFGFFFPAGVPAPILDQVSRNIVAVLRTPSIKERLTADGADVVGNSPEQFAQFVDSELDKWAAVVKSAGLKVE
jgi:tripartite-type tricarboxylate transporter receptor subunit TctC